MVSTPLSRSDRRGELPSSRDHRRGAVSDRSGSDPQVRSHGQRGRHRPASRRSDPDDRRCARPPPRPDHGLHTRPSTAAVKPLLITSASSARSEREPSVSQREIPLNGRSPYRLARWETRARSGVAGSRWPARWGDHEDHGGGDTRVPPCSVASGMKRDHRPSRVPSGYDRSVTLQLRTS
jgi:hypothetical protein